MLSFEECRRVAVVLVRARNPQNVGAVARAMHDFGFADLRVVSDYLVALETARSAVDAGEVVRAARTSTDVGEVVRECTLVLGTTAVGERAIEHPVWPIAEAGGRIAEHLAANGEHRAALLFGSEKTGLSNAEMSHCHALVTIPMAQHAGVRHPSMNLGQAAAVCLYELVRGRAPARVPEAEAGASGAEVERLRAVFAEVLEESGYMRRHPSNADAEQVRRMVLRMQPSSKDVRVWMGVMRQVLWRLREGGVTPRSDPQ